MLTPDKLINWARRLRPSVDHVELPVTFNSIDGIIFVSPTIEPIARSFRWRIPIARRQSKKKPNEIQLLPARTQISLPGFTSFTLYLSRFVMLINNHGLTNPIDPLYLDRLNTSTRERLFRVTENPFDYTNAAFDTRRTELSDNLVEDLARQLKTVHESRKLASDLDHELPAGVHSVDSTISDSDVMKTFNKIFGD